MRLLSSRPAMAVALAASFGLVASPILAAPVSHPRAAPTAAALPNDVAQDRGWGGGGWGNGGWGGRRHHDGIDGGDVLAGVLVIGAIAAIASSASKAKRDKEIAQGRDYDDRYSTPPRSEAGQSDWGRSRSIDYAVDTCVGEVERGSTRVDTVDGIDREGQGWRVSGRTRNGDPFACTVDGEGRVRGMSVNGAAPYRD